jgi:L-alanine-DL-glutamate epimerase-like enolase superfamily enzyme
MQLTSITSRLIGVDARPQYGDRALRPGEPETWEYLLTTVGTDAGVEGHSMLWGVNREGRGLGHLVQDVFTDVLIGTDPLAIEARWQGLRDRTRGTYPLSDSIVALLDVAFWDIAGKVAGLPIVDLLGRYRSHVPAYASPSAFDSLTVEGTRVEAAAVQAAGYRGYKLWSVLGPERDVPRLHAAREAVGPDFPLMADAGGHYRFSEAMAVGRVLDDLHYRWFEEPISDYHIPLLARLAAELRTPILAGEKTTPLGFLPEYVRQGAVDIVRGDVLMKAGITGMRKLAILAELHGYDLEIHGTLTPLLDIANLHVSGAIRNSEYAETFWEPYYRFGLKGSPLVPGPDGMLAVPTAPGLGVELDWDWLDDHTIEEFPQSRARLIGT